MTIVVKDGNGATQTIATLDDLMQIVATQTTLAAILAKVSADPATQTTLAAVLTALGTNHADQLQLHTDIATTIAALQGTGNTSLAAILAKLSSDPATQTTLAAIATTLAGTLSVAATQIGEVQASPTANTVLDRLKTLGLKDFATQTTLASFLTANHTDLAAILAKLSADPATQTTLAAVLTACQAATPAGENHIGEVGGKQVVWQPSDATLTRPANATAYAAHQAIGSSSACLFKFTNFFRKNGGTGLLSGLRLTANAASIATSNMGSVRAHLYNAAPSSVPTADQQTWNSLVANAPSKLGVVDFSAWNIGGAGSDVIDSFGAQILQNLPLVAAGSARDLYLVLEATAAFTPIASAIIQPYASAFLD